MGNANYIWYRQEISNLKNKIKELESRLNTVKPLQMYWIKLNPYTVNVVCKYCFEKGEIDSNCNNCGGKGTHRKTKHRWEVYHHPIEVYKIDRDENNELRYWEDMSCFFRETEKLCYFTKDEAQKECDKRNKISQ